MALRTEFSSISITCRTVIAALVLCAIYLFYGPPDYVEMETINVVFYVFIAAPILITGTILISFLVGTPLRANQALFNWWYKRPFISLSGILVGIFLCRLSGNQTLMQQFGHPLTVDEQGNIISNFYLLCTGWFITAFSIIHTYFSSVIQFIKGEWKA